MSSCEAGEADAAVGPSARARPRRGLRGRGPLPQRECLTCTFKQASRRFRFARGDANESDAAVPCKAAGIRARFTPHGFRRTFNNLARQVAGEIVTRAMTGHVTPSMTEHYSHVGAEEKHAAVGRIVRLVVPSSPEKVGDQVGDRAETKKAAGEAAFEDNGTTSISGAGDGDRTRDPRLGKPMLYH